MIDLSPVTEALFGYRSDILEILSVFPFMGRGKKKIYILDEDQVESICSDIVGMYSDYHIIIKREEVELTKDGQKVPGYMLRIFIKGRQMTVPYMDQGDLQ